MINPIEAAVAPLKKDAVERAIKEAHNLIEHLSRRLNECEGNADTLAPYPRYNDPAYKEKRARRELLESLSKSVKVTRSYNEPDIREMDGDRINAFVKNAMALAASQYDAFVSKLVTKIGPVESAKLEGNHVWGYSILSVAKEGANENWKTQQIVNVSVHGKLFNQWPTRKMK